MGKVHKQCQTRTYWAVAEERADGYWFHHGFPQETQELGYKKLRWLRRWHPNAFLVSMVMTQCDSESAEPSLPIRYAEPQPAGKPQLHLV